MRNERGETLADIVSIGAMLASWIVPPVVFIAQGWTAGWSWLIWWGWLAVSLGATELASKLVTGRTISQHFWRWSAAADKDGRYKNAWKAVGMLALWTVGWGIFVLHLSWKMITGKKYEDG